jgi:acetyl-CoA carboxylase/biotin carboxylase 1
VLVANNGMAAAKCIMSIRRWAFLNLGDEQAIQFVAMVRPMRYQAAPALLRAAWRALGA